MLNMKNLVTFLIIFLILCINTEHTQASKGDQSPIFQSCVEQCISEKCTPSSPSLPLALRLTFWTCPENCEYECMHEITDHAKSHGDPIVQYHGKWPFYRLFGIQEPASVLFSIGNGYMHYRSWPVLLRSIPDSYFMKPFYLACVVVGINTWLWSAVFHTRDLSITEKLDYFSAALSILYSLFYATIRIFHIRSSVKIYTVAGILSACFLAHTSYLTFVHFDYVYNMVASVTVGMLHNFLWVSWSIYHSFLIPRDQRPRYAWQPLVFVVAISAAMSLEIFDFPPWWGILDAHSLWHAATIPIVPLWYRFLITDADSQAMRKEVVKKI